MRCGADVQSMEHRKERVPYAILRVVAIYLCPYQNFAYQVSASNLFIVWHPTYRRGIHYAHMNQLIFLEKYPFSECSKSVFISVIVKV